MVYEDDEYAVGGLSREQFQALEDSLRSPGVPLYKLTYESAPGHLTTWVKTAEELLQPNGSEPLLAWLFREVSSSGGEFSLHRVGSA